MMSRKILLLKSVFLIFLTFQPGYSQTTKSDDEKLLDEARQKFSEAAQLGENNNFDRAIEPATRALEIREKILGANSAETLASFLALSRLYQAKNNQTQAEAFARRALEAAEKISGADSLSYADALTALARIRFSQAVYAESESLNRQALEIREKKAGAESLAAADSLQNLGVLYRAMNDYPKAEQNFTKALAIYEKLLGENHFETAQILHNFGLFYYGAGDFEKASAFLNRALAIKEKIFPPNHSQIAVTLNGLGLVQWKKGDYEKAKAYFLRGLSIYEIANGADSDGVSKIVGNLGIIYKENERNYAKAEEYYKRALAINEKNFGEYHQSTGNLVSSLAILYRRLGDYEQAEQFALRAQAINEKVYGDFNHYTMLSLEALVGVYAAKNDVRRAAEYLKRLAAIQEKVVPLNLRIGSEKQKIAYYKLVSRFDKIITMHAGLARDDETMRDLAVTTILQHKGRVLDAVSESLSALRQRFSAEDQKLLDDLSEINSRLSKVISSGRQKISAEEQQKQIKALETEREKLESEISRRSAGFYESSQAVTLATVQSAIPSDAALVEFAVYRPYKWNAGLGDESGYGEPRYIAYVLKKTGEIEWKDLGDAKTIDAAINEFRKALRDPKRKDASQLARAAYEKLMQPLRPFLSGAKHLLVSPDGELNLIPFEALVDEKGRYLIENYSFSYLTGGRDLLRMQTARASKSKSLIVANPTFSESAEEQTVKISANEKTDSDGKRRSITAARNLSDTYFAPLGGTLSEARSIQTIFPDAVSLTGAQASETALKAVTAPRILHVATHGFFLENSDDAKTEIQNPLLRSGLAFAGANRRDEAAKDDGILTALEASGLNLWGTKLVVLSACDTGIGEVKNGEGVYGLRRAFTQAGTETLVMSLWAVSDYATRELMTNYYKNLKQGSGRGASLRQVQLEMLKRKGREHPFYWAAFIQSGEWANLDGKR